MPTELREMLHDAVDSPPYDGADLRDLLDAGRRRVRARRRTMATVAAAVALAVAGTAVLLPRVGGSPGPVAPVQPVGKVVHPADAVDAVRGKDYRLLYRHDSGNLDRANGISIGPVAEDGSLLVEDGPHGIHNRSRYGVLDPVTGRTRWLPAPAGAGDNGLRVVGFDRDRLVLTDDAADGKHLGVWVLDRHADTWKRIQVDATSAGLSFDSLAGGLLSGNRVYLSVTGTDGRPASRERGHLWSVALTPGATLRDEHVQVGTFDVTDGVLTYMAWDNRPTSELHVRDLATGDDRTYDTRSGRHCNQLGLSRIGDDIALMQYCGTHKGVRDDRVQVVTATGAPVVTVQGNDLELDQATDRFVSVVDYLGPSAGTYVYDLDRGRLLRVSHGRSHFAGSGNGHGSRLIWSTPILHGHGRTQWVADFR